MANIVRRDPFSGGSASPVSLRDPFDLISPLFGRVMGLGAEGSSPRMDVRESEDAYLLEMEMPGVDKNAITVSVCNDTVRVEAEARHEKDAGEAWKWLHRERSFGTVSRTIELPEEMDEKKSTARFENGVLILTLPKKRTAASKRLTIH